MASRISSCSTSTSIEIEDASRRQIKGELATLRQKVLDFKMNDPLTKRITDWMNGFSELLQTNKSDPNEIREAYRKLLKDLLVDDLTQRPLDQTAQVGSDNKTYCKHTLDTYSSQAPAPYNSRSPLDPKNQAAFTFTSHEVVRYLLAWLEDATSLTKSPQELEKTRLIRIQASRTEAKARQFHATLQEANERAQRIKEQFLQFKQGVTGNQEKQKAEIENLVQKEKEVKAALQQEIQKLRVETAQLKEQVQECDAKLNSVNTRLSETERANIELQKAVAAAKQAAKEQSKMAFGIVLGCLAAAAFTWGLSTLGTGSIKVIPTFASRFSPSHVGIKLVVPI